LIEVYGFIITYGFANAAFLFFNVKTGFRVYVTDKRICLRKVYMDSFTWRYILIKRVGCIDWAVICACCTACAFILYNVSRLFNQGYLEIPCFPLYAINFC